MTGTDWQIFRTMDAIRRMEHQLLTEAIRYWMAHGEFDRGSAPQDRLMAANMRAGSAGFRSKSTRLLQSLGALGMGQVGGGEQQAEPYRASCSNLRGPMGDPEAGQRMAPAMQSLRSWAS